MPITYTPGSVSSSSNTASGLVSSGTINFQAGELVTAVMVFTDANPAGNVTMANNNGALTWTLIQDASVGGGCRVIAWWARVDTTGNRQLQPTWDSGNNLTWAMYWIRHVDADAGATPIGGSSKGTGASSVSYTLTPAAAGSALWMVAADANGANVQSITAGTNCAVDQQSIGDQFTSALIRPATNPRTDGSAFTLAETHTGSGVSWVGFEVKAASSGPPQSVRSMHQRCLHGMS